LSCGHSKKRTSLAKHEAIPIQAAQKNPDTLFDPDGYYSPEENQTYKPYTPDILSIYTIAYDKQYILTDYLNTKQILN
jgi:hypothetical protein